MVAGAMRAVVGRQWAVVEKGSGAGAGKQRLVVVKQQMVVGRLTLAVAGRGPPGKKPASFICSAENIGKEGAFRLDTKLKIGEGLERQGGGGRAKICRGVSGTCREYGVFTGGGDAVEEGGGGGAMPGGGEGLAICSCYAFTCQAGHV